MGRLSGKTAIVTGATGGLGGGLARAFANEGARVCVTDLSQERCSEVAAEIGGSAFGLGVDITDVASIDRFYKRIEEMNAIPDVLVNAAGVLGLQMLSDVTQEEFNRIFAVNTGGVIFMAQGAARLMIANKKQGSIINISSGSGRRGHPGATVYAASKAAVISVTQSMSQELISHGIRVNGIAPGAIRTPMWNQVYEGFNKVFGVSKEDVDAKFKAETPVGRISTPDDYVGPALFLATSDSGYVVGQTINVDGGTFMG